MSERKASKKAVIESPTPRQPNLQWFRAQARKVLRASSVAAPKRLPSVWWLSRQTMTLLRRHWKPFVGITVVYALLTVLLVRGLGSGVDIGQLKGQFGTLFGGGLGELAVDFSIFATLLSSSSAGAGASTGTYQLLLIIIISLATIWTLRQVVAGKPARLRDAFYKGMYPLVPFVLVLLVVLLQTTPAIAGGTLYGLAVQYGIAYSISEKLIWGAVFLALSLVSVYMLCSSLFALYIVALPDVTPMKALRSARELVLYRRAAVFRKLFFVPVALFVLAVVIVVPIIAVAPPLAPWAVFLLGTVSVVVVNAYMYVLYRELLA